MEQTDERTACYNMPINAFLNSGLTTASAVKPQGDLCDVKTGKEGSE